jgi:aspartate aminotransferase
VLDRGRAGLIGKTTPEGARLVEDGDVVMYLLAHAVVAVVAGAAYGLSPYFRLSIATSLECWRKVAYAFARLLAAKHETLAGLSNLPALARDDWPLL